MRETITYTQSILCINAAIIYATISIFVSVQPFKEFSELCMWVIISSVYCLNLVCFLLYSAFIVHNIQVLWLFLSKIRLSMLYKVYSLGLFCTNLLMKGWEYQFKSVERRLTWGSVINRILWYWERPAVARRAQLW